MDLIGPFKNDLKRNENNSSELKAIKTIPQSIRKINKSIKNINNGIILNRDDLMAITLLRFVNQGCVAGSNDVVGKVYHSYQVLSVTDSYR